VSVRLRNAALKSAEIPEQSAARRSSHTVALLICAVDASLLPPTKLDLGAPLQAPEPPKSQNKHRSGSARRMTRNGQQASALILTGTLCALRSALPWRSCMSHKNSWQFSRGSSRHRQ
uniref:Uncharacterized protein n=1 Tax=Tetraodon nigroviridis TaxID=99883 RepID=H3C4B3_TETNG